MIDPELQRIARLYGATEQDQREVVRRAVEEPLVPLDEIMAHVVARALAQGHARTSSSEP